MRPETVRKWIRDNDILITRFRYHAGISEAGYRAFVAGRAAKPIIDKIKSVMSDKERLRKIILESIEFHTKKRAWSPEDDMKLIQMRFKQYTISECADALERSVSGIKARLATLQGSKGKGVTGSIKKQRKVITKKECIVPGCKRIVKSEGPHHRMCDHHRRGET